MLVPRELHGIPTLCLLLTQSACKSRFPKDAVTAVTTLVLIPKLELLGAWIDAKLPHDTQTAVLLCFVVLVNRMLTDAQHICIKQERGIHRQGLGNPGKRQKTRLPCPWTCRE